MNILTPGEVVCDRCNGNDYFCEKCLGEGKLDWIENVVGKPRTNSTLDNINIRRLSNELKKTLNDNYYTINQDHNEIKYLLESQLDQFRQRQIIREYNIDFILNCNSDSGIGPSADINITLNLNRTFEHININFQLR
jgi:hypothetical protein